MARISVALLLFCACADPGPPPSLVRDVRTLRAIMADDPAEAKIGEAEAELDDRRPVRAGHLVEREVLPMARRQIEKVRDAELGTPEGRRYARRLRTAYSTRVRGLRIWRRYLDGEATDDDLLLESSSLLRNAQLEVIAVDRAMDTVTPSD